MAMHMLNTLPKIISIVFHSLLIYNLIDAQSVIPPPFFTFEGNLFEAHLIC